MNAQFHTPSLGDEVIYESDGANSFVQQLQSKRMRNMDHSLDEYHSANDESFGNNTSASLFTSPSPVAAAGAPAPIAIGARKLLTTIDPKEPTKPLSPYALFFRDTVSAIKQQNPNCSFQELKLIVASMWEALDPSHKNVYNKKNEMACNDYLKQMRIYRQQQEQQQQLDAPANDPSNNGMQSKPAVFTISRSDGGSGNAMANYTNQMVATSPQHNHFSATSPSAQPQYMQSQEEVPLHSQQQQQNMSEQSATANHIMPATTATTDPSPQQIQMLTEAGSVQKCTRESCTKRAIINPDWEDEYCSNECVVIHCRNVFNTWVQSNLDARKQ